MTQCHTFNLSHKEVILSSKVVKLTTEAAKYKCSVKDAMDVMQIIDLHAAGAELSSEAIAQLVKFAKWEIIKTSAIASLVRDEVDADGASAQGSKFVKQGELTPVGTPFSLGDLDMQIFSTDGSKPSNEVIEAAKESFKAKIMQMFGLKPPKTNPLFEPSENAEDDFKPKSKMEIFCDEHGKKRFKVRYRKASGEGFTEHSVTYQTGEEAHSKTTELLKDSSVIPWDE